MAVATARRRAHGDKYRFGLADAGAGNYNRYLGSLKIGLNGVVEFSTFPLQLMMWTGFAIALLSVIGIL